MPLEPARHDDPADRHDERHTIDGEFHDDPTEHLEPPTPLAPALLGVSIGGSRFEAGLVSADGELIDRATAPIDPDTGPETHFSTIAELVETQLGLSDHHQVRITAVGVVSGGDVGPNCETVSPPNVASWNEFPLRERLREVTAKRVYGELDAKALALAEGWKGAAKGFDNYCVMSVGSTIGGGIVLDGELLEGAAGHAGYVGHLTVEPNGRRCACGARGCLDAEASGLAIESITGRSPDEPTYEIMQRTGRLVGRAAASLCNLLDIELVVVGGSVALGFAATFFNAAQEVLSTDARLPYSSHARITPTRLGDRGPLLAAGAVAIRGWQRDRANAKRAAATERKVG